jgi:EXS domain-containing protein
MDWGFLEENTKNKFLRNELAYNNKTYYYLAISVNLMLRCAWVFSISPDLIARFLRPELFQAIIGFMEIFRRSVWNLLR